MSIYVAGGPVGYHHAGMEDLARKLKEGDGIFFAGDPDLDLHMGVITDRRTGKIVARRYEVWRRCEDGEDRIIGHWRLEEFDQILGDIAVMSGAVRGRVESAETRIDKHIEQVKKDQQDEYVEKMYPLMEHAIQVQQAQDGEPQNRFYMNDIKKKPDADDQ